MFLLRILSRKRLCWFSFRLVLVCSIFLSIGVFVVNVLMSPRPSLIKQSQNTFEEELAKPLKFHEKKDEILPSRAGGADKKRINLIIVAHGRSGSTFLGNIFNNHPSVFYLFEPYQTAERLLRSQAYNSENYQEKAYRWMQGVFQCNFVSPAHVSDLESYYRSKYPENYNPMKSLTLLSPPFCPYNATDPRWTMESCYPLNQETLEETCKNKYSVTVVKVLISRMPGGNLNQLLSICNSADEFECKFLFLVRDPRGIIPSSRAVGFYGDSDKVSLNGTQRFSHKICSATEANLDIIQSLKSVEKSARFMLLRYEDLAANPLKTLPSLLRFAGLSMDDSLTTWLDLASHLPETESEQKAALWRQDSQQGAERWRWKVKPGVISVIEENCKRVMNALGYKPVNGSHKIQSNLTLSLLEDDYEAMQWFKDTSTNVWE